MPRFTKEGHRQRCAAQLSSVVQYFSEVPARWEQVYPLMCSPSGGFSSGLSKRLLDYLVTTYSKEHVCQYSVTDADGQTRIVNVHESAQTILYGHHKRSLDPFRRRNTCMDAGGVFEFGPDGMRARTTLAQLTFFRWAQRNKVLDYARAHADEIRAAMASKARRKRNQQWPDEIVIEFAGSPPPPPLSPPLAKKRRSRRASTTIVFNTDAAETTSFAS